LLPSGPGRFPLQRRLAFPLQGTLRHRRPHGAGFIANLRVVAEASHAMESYWPRFTPSARGGGDPPSPTHAK